MRIVSEELTWVWEYLWRYKFMSIVTILGSIIEIILFSMPAIYTAKIVDLFLNEAPLQSVLIWLGAMLGTALLQSGIFYVTATTNEILAHRVTTDMTSDLFKELQKRPLAYHDQIHIGEVMSRATGDTRTINIGLSPAFRIIGQIITALIFTITVLSSINIKLTIFLFIAAPIYSFFIIRYGKRLEPLNKEVQDKFGDLSNHTAEAISGVRELKSYTAEVIAKQKFNRYSQIHAEKIKIAGFNAAIYAHGFIMAITLGLTTFFGVYLIIQGELTISQLVVFTGLISFLVFISRNLGWVAEYLARTNAAARRIREMLFSKTKPIPEGQNDFPREDTTIIFEHVYFSYENSTNYALKNIHVKINHGETVAIVGGPGSGKSTLNKLILHLYQPDKGVIKIGGNPLNAYKNDSIRENIKAIEQDVFLFYDSIKNNIAFGRPSVNDEEIVEAAKIANAHKFILETEEGYNTKIGERGVRLSGGQKQRIAIARALIMDPAILIMDDASSALDAETEMKIQEAIRGVLKTRTSIITTHRLAIISEADRVLLLDKGEIIANGPHEVLIRSSEEYRRLFEGHYQLPPLVQEVTYHD